MEETKTPQSEPQRHGHGGGDRRSGMPPRRPRATEPREFDEKVIEVNRVTRVVKGGKRMRFRTLVVIGDHAGRIAYGLGKAGDVTTAVTKAVATAKKDIRRIYLKNGTLPYQVLYRAKSAEVLIKPAKPGTGLIAGGAVRIVLGAPADPPRSRDHVDVTVVRMKVRAAHVTRLPLGQFDVDPRLGGVASQNRVSAAGWTFDPLDLVRKLERHYGRVGIGGPDRPKRRENTDRQSELH